MVRKGNTYVLTGEPEHIETSEYNVGSLTLEDAEEIDEYYNFRSDYSLQSFRENITLRDSTCVRIDGELAAWCCVHAEDNSMGPLFTKEAYRGRGLALIVSLRLMEKLTLANSKQFPMQQLLL